MRDLDYDPSVQSDDPDDEHLFDREVIQDDEDLLMMHCLLGNVLCGSLETE